MLKLNDVVRIKERKENQENIYPYYTDDMAKMKGEIHKIEEIYRKGMITYKINGKFFRKEWISPLKEERKWKR